MKKLILNKLDSQGLIINSGKIELIQFDYITILDNILICCFQNIPKNNLLGIYIRGSVAIGRAIKNFSDVDCVIIVKKDVKDILWKIKLSKDIIKLYPYVTMVDLTIVNENDILNSPNLIRLRTNLVAQTVCLYGKEITTIIPPIKPDKQLAINLYKNLAEELNELRDYFALNIERDFQQIIRPPRFWCVWTMRDIIRSGLALVMIDKPVYSQDLETCLEIFSLEYPQYKAIMQKALELERTPPDDKKVVLDFLDSFLPDYLALWQKKAII